MSRTLHLKNNNNKPKINPEAYTCRMSSVGQGGNLTYEFDPDPTKVLWNMTANVQQTETRGGQVAYSTGRTIGPLQIVGYCRSRWDLKELGDFIGLHMNEAVQRGHPLRFIYPEREVDFLIYITDIANIGYDAEASEISAYAINATVTQDHSRLTNPQRSYLIDNPMLENVEWIDVKRAAEIAEERFGAMVGSGLDELETGNPADEEDVANPSDPPDGRTRVSDDPNERLPDPGDRGENENTPRRIREKKQRGSVKTWRDRNSASPWEVARRSLNPFDENPFR